MSVEARALPLQHRLQSRARRATRISKNFTSDVLGVGRTQSLPYHLTVVWWTA